MSIPMSFITGSNNVERRQRQQRLGFFAAASLLMLVMLMLCPEMSSGEGIGCFKCVSLNGSNPACEDDFHNNYTENIYEKPCMGGRKGRNGLFPASSCIKLSGRYSDGSGTLMIRACSLDSGTLTTDTEIIRMSHCGSFYYEGKYVHGCVQSCDDVDACNGAQVIRLNSLQVFFFVSFISVTVNAHLSNLPNQYPP